MLPFQPETLEAIRARLPQAVAKLQTADAQVGRQRAHVFDFQDGVRCIISVDAIAPDDFSLHLSFSMVPGALDFIHFMKRVDEIPFELWPDLLLVLQQNVPTRCAIHSFFEIPLAWKPFLKVCEEAPKIESSAS